MVGLSYSSTDDFLPNILVNAKITHALVLGVLYCKLHEFTNQSIQLFLNIV